MYTSTHSNYLCAGVFLCSVNIRMDKFSGDIARVLLSINNDKDLHNGLSIVKGSARSP